MQSNHNQIQAPLVQSLEVSAEHSRVENNQNSGAVFENNQTIIQQSQSLIRNVTELIVCEEETKVQNQYQREESKEEGSDGIHPTLKPLFIKIQQIISEFQSDRRCSNSKHKTFKAQSPKMDMKIEKRVIDLSMGKEVSEISDEQSYYSRNSKTIILKTESKINQCFFNPKIKELRQGLADKNCRKAKRSKSKGISLVSPKSKKKYNQKESNSSKIVFLQKKIYTSRKENRERKSSCSNPTNFFNGRRVSTKLF